MNLKKVQQLYLKIIPMFHVKKPWDIIIIFVLNVLLTIPIFIIAHHNLIDLNWKYQLDRILLVVVIVCCLQLILMFLRKVTLISVFGYLIALFYGTLFGGYDFETVFEDYRYMIYSMNENPNPQDIIVSKLLPFPSKKKIIRAIEYQNPKIRKFAVMAVNKHFNNLKYYGKYRTIIQCLAVFKEINLRWYYVSDPKGYDYIANATESLLYLSGNCEAHSVFMAACIKSIGGTVRIIHTKGHMYPELLIGLKSDLENLNYRIKKELFAKESHGKRLHYHLDERGQVWLNLDYTASYPGGPFMHEEILGALTLY
jgi:hypothetical protein